VYDFGDGVASIRHDVTGAHLAMIDWLSRSLDDQNWGEMGANGHDISGFVTLPIGHEI